MAKTAKYPTLSLTSPPKSGESVRLLQFLLRHNRTGQDFLKSNIDGVYGAQTAAAVRRAKFWLGYETKKLNGIATDILFRYLVKKTNKNFEPLPKAFALRRRLRIEEAKRKAALVPDRVKALNVAKTQVGVHEKGASNVVVYSVWYGMIGPWCAMFDSWCFDRVGAGKKFHYAYCPYVWDDARRGRNGLSVVNSGHVKPGDLVLFNWGSGEAKHIGFVEKSLGGGYYQTIEGNTAPNDSGNQSNGGGVYRRKRHISQILGFVRVH